MHFAAQTAKQSQLVRHSEINLAPQSGDLRLDRVVIMDADRETRIARKESERFRLGFFKIPARQINIEPGAPGQRVAHLAVEPGHDADGAVPVLLKPAIRQEVLAKIHVLRARERRDRQRAAKLRAFQPDRAARRPGIAIGQRIIIGLGDVPVFVRVRDPE